MFGAAAYRHLSLRASSGGLLQRASAVAIEEAVVNDNNSMLKYWFKVEDFLEVAANTMVVVEDAQTHYSRPSSRLQLQRL